MKKFTNKFNESKGIELRFDKIELRFGYNKFSRYKSVGWYTWRNNKLFRFYNNERYSPYKCRIIEMFIINIGISIRIKL